jgi:hypothetical protein
MFAMVSAESNIFPLYLWIVAGFVVYKHCITSKDTTTTCPTISSGSVIACYLVGPAMFHRPEYQPLTQSSRFPRNKSSNRLAPLSQLNSTIGRHLARPKKPAQTSLICDVAGTAYHDTSHQPAHTLGRTSLSKSNAPPPASTNHREATSTHPSLPPVITRKLSDRDLLASQLRRRASSQSLHGASRSRAYGSLKRTLTIRQSKTTRTTARYGCADVAGSMFSAAMGAKGLDRSVARRFSFEYGREILSLKPDPKTEADSNVGLQSGIAGNAGGGGVEPSMQYFVDVGLDIPPRQYAPAQTFGEMLGLQRVPTALME